MALSPARITVNTTAVELTTPETDLSLSEGSSISVKVLAGSVSVGRSDVTVATGYPLDTGESFAMDLNKNEKLFAISATAGATVAVMRSGV